MEDIFTSEWFYDEKNIGTKIKSPVELLVGMQRMLPMKLDNEEIIIVSATHRWAIIILSAECCGLARRQSLD